MSAFAASLPAPWVNVPFAAALAPAALSFARALHDPRAAQTEALARIVAELAPSRRHKALRGVRTLRDLQSAAPVTRYEDYARDLDDAASGARAVLSRAPVVRFERSGGSSGAQKLLPQTRPFLAEMGRALNAWLFDLYARTPGVARGCAYWSISPMGAKAGKTAGGIPIGADDDASYFPAPVRALLDRVLAVPSALARELARLDDVDACRVRTLEQLLVRDDLTLVSVWSPTFLLLLLDALARHRELLARRLRDVHARPERAALLERTLAPKVLWPHLALVSMWTDAASGAFVDDVRARIGDVPLQPKGLLATEGVVSIPWRGARPLAITSHVLEFRSVRDASVDATHSADDERPRLAHEIEVGRTYEVLLTTSAGLVRYALGDRVAVTGAVHATPTICFVGRAGVVGDLVGEKLALDFVAHVLAQEARGARFAMLAPSLAPRGYVLYVDLDGAPVTSSTSSTSSTSLDALAARVDARLSEGHPYRYARALGQLAPVRARQVPNAIARYEEACVRRGQRAGDVKPTALHLATDWDAAFGA